MLHYFLSKEITAVGDKALDSWKTEQTLTQQNVMKHERKHSILVQHSHFFKNKEMCENQKNSWNSSKKRNLVASTSGETEKTKKQIKLPTITKGDRKPNQQNVAFLGFYSALKLKVDLQVYQFYTSSEEPGWI